MNVLPTPTADIEPSPLPSRIALVDVARGLALAAMFVFHFAWDLSFLKLIATDIAQHPGWRLFAHAIAGSFLTLAGLSIGLAHADGIRWKRFWRRLAVLGLAALAVTAGTWAALPDGVVMFGILHCIALGSLACLAFIRGPWWAPLPAALLVAVLPGIATGAGWSGLQDSIEGGALSAVWQHLGLGTTAPDAVDFVPLFPWLAFMLAGLSAGLALARTGTGKGLRTRLASVGLPRFARPAAWAGRNSLLIYLIHQPILIGGLMALIWLAPGLTDSLRSATVEKVRSACVMECRMTRSAEVCAAGCNCMLEALRRDRSQYERIVIMGQGGPGSEQAIADASMMCFKPAPSN